MSGFTPLPADDLPDNLKPRAAPKFTPLPDNDLPDNLKPTSLLDHVGNAAGQVGLGALEGLARLPGLPFDIAAAGGNFVHRQLGEPEVPLADTSLKNLGGDAWYAWAQQHLGVPQGPAPSNGVERIARKAGTFLGSGLPFGPAAMVPTAVAVAGSEAGRLADQMAPGKTHGYGETVGGIVGGVTPAAVTGTVRGVSNVMRGAAPEALAPSIGALRAEAKAGFDALKDSDVIVTPQGLTRLASTIRSDLGREGYSARLQTGIGAVLDELNDKITSAGQGLQGVTYQDMINLRRLAQSAGQGPVPYGQGVLSGKVVDHIDDFLKTLPDRPTDFLAGGDPAAAKAMLEQANSAYSRFKKADTLHEAVQRGIDNAGPHVGNVEAMISTQLKGLLRNQKTARQFSPLEREAIRRIVHGDNLQNVLRFAGKASPENWISGLAELYGALGALHNPVMAAGSVAAAGGGFLARRAAGARTNAAINSLSEQLRRGDGSINARFPPSPNSPPPIDEPPPIGPTSGPPSPRGPQPPIMPGPRRLPPPSAPALSGTMYSNPLDPAAFKALFFRGMKPPTRARLDTARAATPARQPNAADVITQQNLNAKPLELGPENEAQIAYHGTPHDFERFDMSRMGTGEGAQAYGKGLYFAENEGVARSYRDDLSQGRDLVINEPGGRRTIPAPQRIGTDARGFTPEQLATKQINTVGNFDSALSNLEWSAARHRNAAQFTRDDLTRPGHNAKSRAATLANADAYAQDAQRYKEAANWLRDNKSNLELGQPKTGNMFQVAIKAAPEDFINWDALPEQQPAKVQNALQSILGRSAARSPDWKKLVASTEGVQKLRALGIKGVKYLDQQSRVGQGGTSNYVIFDDKIISVLKKYGIPMTLTATGAALVQGVNMPPDVAKQINPGT